MSSERQAAPRYKPLTLLTMLTLLTLLKLLKLLHRFGAKGRIYTYNMVVPYTLTFCSEGHNAYGGLLSKKSECLDNWVGGHTFDRFDN